MSVKVRPYKKGGWEADIVVRLTDGTFYRERRKAPGATKADAKHWARDRESYLIRNGKPVREEDKEEVPTVEEFRSRFIEEHGRANRHKPSTLISKESIFRNHLLPVLGNVRMDELTEEHVQRLKGSLAKHSPKTVNCVLAVLNKMLRTALKWHVIEALPITMEFVKAPPTVMRFYDDDEYERLILAASQVGPLVQLVVLLAGDAGLRAGEIMALEQADIDWTHGLITVQRSEWRGNVTVPKGGRSRRVPITQRLRSALLASRHLRGPRVFYRPEGEHVRARTLRTWLEQTQEIAGVRATGAIHILRHTFCSRLAMRGAPAKAIQELAGHADLSTTLRYMHLSPGAKESAVRLLETPITSPLHGDIPETNKGPSRSP